MQTIVLYMISAIKTPCCQYYYMHMNTLSQHNNIVSPRTVHGGHTDVTCLSVCPMTSHSSTNTDGHSICYIVLSL